MINKNLLIKQFYKLKRNKLYSYIFEKKITLNLIFNLLSHEL